MSLSVSAENSNLDSNLDSKICVQALTEPSEDKIINGFDHIIGEIKPHNTDTNKLVMSQTARILLQYSESKDKKRLDTVENIRTKIQDVMYGTVYSSKRMGVDEFTDIYYNSDSGGEDDEAEDNEHFVSYKTIDGSGNFVNYPGGGVIYHTSNNIMFDCLNIEYMIYKNIIPISSIDIDKNKVYNVKRSSGEINKCKIYSNSSLRISKTHNTPLIYLTFRDDGIDPNESETYSIEREKEVLIRDFMELNDIPNITITKNFLKRGDYNFPEDYFMSNELIDELISNYNTLLTDHINEQIEKYYCDFGENIINVV